jgi:large subunit ribosomal protein L35
MPKAKTNSGAKKRFRFTGSGQIRRNKAYHRHILTKKTAKRKRSLRGDAIVHDTDHARVERMLTA